MGRERAEARGGANGSALALVMMISIQGLEIFEFAACEKRDAPQNLANLKI
jgi:hypothetical protein